MNKNRHETTIYTIGHSTRPLEEFIEILKANGIKEVVDIRTVPRSRHNPQYNIETLPDSLKSAGIDYVHMDGLGGLRHARRDSINTAWRNSAFRGFADYMQTPEFTENLNKLIELSRKTRLTLMCAEAVPWRCHRSLIGDALLIRGIKVIDIIGKESLREHKMTPFAKIDGERITYPGEEKTQDTNRQLT